MRNETISEKPLSSKQLNLIVHLVAGDSVATASQRTKISTATAFRWLGEPAFSRALKSARAKAYNESLGRLRVAANRAVDVLIAGLSVKNQDKRRLAAKDILTLADRAVGKEDIRDRINEIERILDEQAEGKRRLKDPI